jgi:hypothetical protein
LVAAGAMNRYRVVIGMDSFFHVRPLLTGRSARMTTALQNRVARPVES